MKMPLIALLLFLLPVALPAQGMNTEKGTYVSVVVPEALFVPEDPDVFRKVFVADVSWAPEGVLINGNPRWRALGFVSPQPMKIDKRKVESKKGYLELKLDQRKGEDLYLRIRLADTSRVLPVLLRPAQDSIAVAEAAR